MKYEGWLPLIRYSVIEAAISIHIGDCDPTAHHRISEADLIGKVLEPAAAVAHEKRLGIVTAEIVSGAETRPEIRIGH